MSAWGKINGMKDEDMVSLHVLLWMTYIVPVALVVVAAVVMLAGPCDFGC
jgi:hypothetical protein